MKFFAFNAATYMSMTTGSQALMLKVGIRENEILKEAIETKAKYSGSIFIQISS